MYKKNKSLKYGQLTVASSPPPISCVVSGLPDAQMFFVRNEIVILEMFTDKTNFTKLL